MRRAIAWYFLHLLIVVATMMAILRLQWPLLAAVTAMCIAVGSAAVTHFARPQPLSYQRYAWSVALAGLSMSFPLLLIGWAGDAGDHQITLVSFLSYLVFALLSQGIILLVGPPLLLLIAAFTGAVLGQAVWRSRTR